ncbi:MAG: hypothetical protein KIT73_10155 [Burkholderiales bacterium]|nr:hypothetical protein [Burkholderiales bacterium]
MNNHPELRPRVLAAVLAATEPVTAAQIAKDLGARQSSVAVCLLYLTQLMVSDIERVRRPAGPKLRMVWVYQQKGKVWPPFHNGLKELDPDAEDADVTDC